MQSGFVYILSNRENGVLYIGATNDLASRLSQHRAGGVSSFTKKYQCHRLVWLERFENIHDARVVERRMKAWKRAWKIELIEKTNPQWQDLAQDLA